MRRRSSAITAARLRAKAAMGAGFGCAKPMDIHLDIRCMLLLVCIEQNMNNAKAGIGPMVIIFSNQWLARPGEKAVASSLLLADRRKNDPLPVFVVCRALMAAQWEMAVRKTSKSIFAAAALAAAMSFNIPAGHAAGSRTLVRVLRI
jgi:hypothetical protein